ncbi:MAG: hypothetical protein NVSMB32_09990 [Actinomycetota bacterium]
MRLCFLLEARYARDGMPLLVAEQLAHWGHDVVVMSPQDEPSEITALVSSGFDAIVLKTVSDGPGLSILDAAAAAGCRTVNDSQAVRRARDKAVTAALARRHGLPFPDTWFAPTPGLFANLNPGLFPLVVKPSNGSSGSNVHVARTADDLALVPTESGCHWLAQPYLTNPGVDLKLYNTGEGIYAELRTSPLEPAPTQPDRLIPVPPELEVLARRVGQVFGLDIYGLDLVQGPAGWTIVDINDFPSFRLVPDGPARVATSVLNLASRPRPVTSSALP